MHSPHPTPLGWNCFVATQNNKSPVTSIFLLYFRFVTLIGLTQTKMKHHKHNVVSIQNKRKLSIAASILHSLQKRNKKVSVSVAAVQSVSLSLKPILFLSLLGSTVSSLLFSPRNDWVEVGTGRVKVQRDQELTVYELLRALTRDVTWRAISHGTQSQSCSVCVCVCVCVCVLARACRSVAHHWNETSPPRLCSWFNLTWRYVILNT